MGKTKCHLNLHAYAVGSPPRVWGKRHGACLGLTHIAVHPHACGENGPTFPPSAAAIWFTPTRVGKTRKQCLEIIGVYGSPPRVWGKRWCPSAGVLPCTRFTPTRVGKTRGHDKIGVDALGSPPRVWGKHICRRERSAERGGSPPRVWGKRRHFGDLSEGCLGSPPRVWGKLCPVADVGQFHSVHPHACGENGTAGTGTGTSSTVHPHACGENGPTFPPSAAAIWFTPTRVGKTDCFAGALCALCGSPPRVWGKHAPQVLDALSVGGSPPRVWGKPPHTRMKPALLSVHPHACGENLDTHSGGRRYYRFTPTRVGKTYWEVDTGALYAVHPHACGENVSLVVALFLYRGSPPRVWGKLAPRGFEESRTVRFTPTRVGKTYRGRCSRYWQTGSPPRVWGKRIPPRLRKFRLHGSPPRVWGKPSPLTCQPSPRPGSPPRVWGKLILRSSRCFLQAGSPPRVWGKLR